MGDGFPVFDIILFAMVAAVLIYRLRGVLGRRTGHEKRRGDAFAPGSGEEDWRAGRGDKVIQLPDRSAKSGLTAPAGEAGSLDAGLDQIAAADRSFSGESFVAGAGEAFKWILGAYASGDTETLRPLLSRQVYGEFASAIEARARAGETLETELVGVKSADLIEAQLEGRTAFVTVKFVTQQVNVIRDIHGQVVDGDPEQVVEVTDIWTFARNTRSRDPNWTLVATRSPG